MSQPTNDVNPTPDGGQIGAQPKPKPRPRRPLSRAKKSAAEQTSATTLASPSATESAPAAETPVMNPIETAPAPGASQTATPPKSGRSRPRRPSGQRQGGGQPAVQLVKPATPDVAPETPTAGEPLPATIAATDQEAPRIVPVVTEPADMEAASTAPLSLDIAEPTPTLAPAPEQESAPVSRYRFGRRPVIAPTNPTLRQERLSGTLALPSTPAEEESRPIAEPMPSASAAEAAPAAELRIEPETRGRDRDAIADIVSALGLQDLAARANAPRPSDTAATTGAEQLDTTATPTDTAETTEEETASAESEATPGRRRRRRRRGSGHAATGTDEDAEEQVAEPVAPLDLDDTESERDTRNGYLDYPGAYYHAEPQPYTPYERGARERSATSDQGWDIGSGTQQVRQSDSPFGAPEPSFARGFGPQPRGVAGPAREPFTRSGRAERGADTPPMSSNVLASTVTHAIQQQTDRLLAELRHQSNPPAMTVMFPPFPSTERVGVFVDVANLLYSSRNLRVSIDFGRLLDFLRGNRRLIRAHAYAPTNPDPHAEQSFLSAVKGLGYRITTKNYKTFSSGAKKADMDLDLCMDIVRIVDAGALDTVVLVSGDSDFLPLLEYCSDHGVRVEVAAFEDAAAMILRQSCDLFVNLSLVDEIRA